jgi:uncharacterized membrane protein
MSDYNIELILVVIGALLGFIGGILALIGAYIANKFGHMTDSVDKLNISIAVVIETLQNHDRRIEKLEGNK